MVFVEAVVIETENGQLNGLPPLHDLRGVSILGWLVMDGANHRDGATPQRGCTIRPFPLISVLGLAILSFLFFLLSVHS